jgi:acetyl-CoA synthetase
MAEGAQAADVPEVKKYPVGKRVKAHHKDPHVGPTIDDYYRSHKETVGHESDAWWAKVRRTRFYAAHS